MLSRCFGYLLLLLAVLSLPFLGAAWLLSLTQKRTERYLRLRRVRLRAGRLPGSV